MDIISKLEKIEILDEFSEFITNSLFKFVRKINPKNKNDVSNIVIISLHRLGDTVFTIPAVKQIFYHFKNKNIFILTFAENKTYIWY